MKIVTRKAEGGATLSFFPASRIAASALREAFGEDVAFRPGDKSWFMGGADARNRLSAWAKSNAESIESAVRAAREAPKAEMDAMSAADLNEAVDAAERSPIVSPLVARSEDLTEWLVRTPYHPEIVAAMREGVIGSRYDRALGAWRVPLTATEPLRAEMPAIERAAREAGNGAVARPETRWLELVVEMPQVGEPMSRNDATVVPVAVGKSFPANKSTLRDHPHLAGHLSEDVAYVYYRDATPDEVEAFEASRPAPAP